MAIAGYSVDIVTEQGASVMNFGDTAQVRFRSGACEIIDSGASIHAFGHTRIESGASLHVDDGASLVVKDGATAGGQPYSILNMGPNQWWYAPGSPGSPTFSASPGDMLWIANSASTSLWVNKSNGTAGSVWLLMRLGGGSQIVTGP